MPASAVSPTHLTPADLAALIDISAVQAFHTAEDVSDLAGIAVRHGFVAAHVLPNFVPVLRTLVPRHGVTMVGGPVGFPSGGHQTEIKVAEAKALVAAGAEELDMMIAVGRLKSGDIGYVRDDITAVVEAVHPIPLKVILEVAHLARDEIVRGCEVVAGSGAAFVKTGTGWTPTATGIETVQLISDVVAGAVKVKASGGIRSLQTIATMVRLGVARFGINTRVAVDLVEECARLPGGRLPISAEPS